MPRQGMLARRLIRTGIVINSSLAEAHWVVLPASCFCVAIGAAEHTGFRECPALKTLGDSLSVGVVMHTS
jgi:hypothetical protein